MEKERLILLKKTKYGESDLILRGLNPFGSKVHLFARSALKSRKRFGGGVLEPLNFVEVVYQGKKRSDESQLRTIGEAHVIRDFPLIRSGYERLQLGLFLLKTIDQWTREGVFDSQGVFNLLGQSLQALETQKDLRKLRVQFLVKLLWIQGELEILEPFRDLLAHSISQADQLRLSPQEMDSLERTLNHRPVQV